MGNTEMNGLGKFHVTPETAYRDFFSCRSAHKYILSRNPLKLGNESASTTTTIETTARYGENVIADISGGSVVRSYVTPGLDANVSMTIVGATPATYYYNQDERQSVVNLTDGTGTVAASYGYSAFGDKVDSLTRHSTPDTQANRYTYTGRESSDVSGDYYFRYRWYGAASGDFFGRDPLGYIDGMSLYAGWFAAAMGLDPLGRRTKEQYPKIPEELKDKLMNNPRGLGLGGYFLRKWKAKKCCCTPGKKLFRSSHETWVVDKWGDAPVGHATIEITYKDKCVTSVDYFFFTCIRVHSSRISDKDERLPSQDGMWGYVPGSFNSEFIYSNHGNTGGNYVVSAYALVEYCDGEVPTRALYRTSYVFNQEGDSLTFHGNTGDWAIVGSQIRKADIIEE